MDRSAFDSALRRLFLLSESRGKEAAGIALASPSKLTVHKDSVSASEMLKTADYERAVERGAAPYFGHGAASLAALGHARLVTNGLQGIDANNQPVWRDDIVIVHNGIVVNWERLWEANPDIKPNAEVDTEVIAALIHKATLSGKDPTAAMASVFNEIEGETSVAFFSEGGNAMWLGTNTGSIHFCSSPDGAFFFASERRICEELTDGRGGLPGFADAEITQLRAGHGLVVRLDTLAATEFSLSGELPVPQTSLTLGVQRTVEDKAFRIQEARKGLLRCSRCLLPSTMPFIAYDADGVCNYCHNHQPWERQDEATLLENLAAARSKDGSPDCVVAFSGGRDSSYGLHLLKQKYGMTPLTFSYDWGMVTDLARRNQARMCGKLGVEHIWISADIRQKRSNIRRNVRAWLSKPDLGIIPLFMAGDKQFFWYANDMIKKSRIPLMVFCTNRYEKTDFKTGFLNIPPRGGRFNTPSTKRWTEKFELIYQYGSRFVGNPRYLNSSIGDTLWAFMSYYGINQDHLYLFDYLDWDEGEIDRTLVGEYNWELADDTVCSWRIGDGTAPFYNYIYHTVAGFTEHDTFRSNQIRDGKITRDEGLRLIDRDNQPRWKSIREYCNLINLDFGELIRGIDRIPKLYMNS
ncbi:Amidophosphoribosyltransferase [Mycolicibacterium aubagnense]